MKLTPQAASGICLCAALALAGCSSTKSLTEYVPQIVTPYRIDIQQGNFVTQDMVDKLQAGQTKEQVRFILGTPLLADVFHTGRWDYVFRSAKGWNDPEKRRLTVFFDKETATRLEKWEAIEVPPPANLAETQAAASGGAEVTVTAQSEEKPGVLGRMFGWLTPSPAVPAAAAPGDAAAATADATERAVAQAAKQQAATDAAAKQAAEQAAEQEAGKQVAAQVIAQAAAQAAAEESARQAAAQQAAAQQAAAQQAANQAAVRAAAEEAARQAAAQEAARAAAAAAEAAAQSAAKQAAAAPVVPATPPGAGSVASTAAITTMVEQWRAAWSAKNPATYLALYAPDFKSGNLTRARWEAQRRERLIKSAFIFVNLSDVQIAQTGDNSATVTFTQQYESETLKETGKKTLLLGNVNGQWLIREEMFKVK